MNAAERLAQRIVSSHVPLTRESVAAAAKELLTEEAPLEDPQITQDVVDSLVGLGPLEDLLRDPAVTDVFVNRPDEIWVDRDGVLTKTKASFQTAEAVRAAVERVINPLGLRLDRASPAVDARLSDGSRLHSAIPPISVDGPVVAIRRFSQAVPDLPALVATGGISESGAGLLQQAVTDRENIIVSGGTGAGKTTLLNVLSTEVPAGQRVVTVEDAAELSLSGHVIRLEARPPNIEGRGEIRLRQLVKHALRLRPDRLIIGEVRGSEALDMISAMNTGHSGSMSTVHANNPEDALWRIETLALSGPEQVDVEAVRRQLRSAVNLVVHMERTPEGRRVAAIGRVEAASVSELAC